MLSLHRGVALAAVSLAVTTLTFAGGAEAAGGKPRIVAEVPSANLRSGSPDSIVAPGFKLNVVVQGSDKLENPSGVITKFGFLNDFPPQTIEASKTEPDENTYLVFKQNPGGPTPHYDYGRHFLFQGHENGGDLAYVTRINLDVKDPEHRITLLTPVGGDGKTHLNRIDGSVWNPFTRALLLTEENGSAGGVIELGVDFGSAPRRLDAIVGQGGYEGIHPDDQGNLLIFEDVGGTAVNVDPTDLSSPKAARNPNSFVFRFVPIDRTNLWAGGELQALQVAIDDAPLTFVAVDAGHPFGDVFSDAQLKLHTPGSSWPCRWVTIHDTAVDGTAPFNANALAKSAGATPFKRPENGQFLPGSGFSSFIFDATGDTDSRSGNQPALAARGAWGSLFRVAFGGNKTKGKISIEFLGDAEHAAFDNLVFADERNLLATEDRGDNLHTQLNRLDSIWAFDVRRSDSNPRRFVALGRDKLSTIDAGLAGTPGFQNDGDNEPTGLHVSNGETSIQQLFGKAAKANGARWFFTQQHGENVVYEILTED